MSSTTGSVSSIDKVPASAPQQNQHKSREQNEHRNDHRYEHRYDNRRGRGGGGGGGGRDREADGNYQNKPVSATYSRGRGNRGKYKCNNIFTSSFIKMVYVEGKCYTLILGMQQSELRDMKLVYCTKCNVQ